MTFTRALVLSLLFIIPILSTAQNSTETERTTIGIRNKKGIRLVYHIKSPEVEKNRISDGVGELRHLVRIYTEEGITKTDRDIHGLFDDDGALFVLNDKAYAKMGKGKINPNAQLISELIDQGVSVEVCGQRLGQEGFSAKDVLPGVKVVISGQARVIDLEMEGYTYFRF